jgi:hypothetical protein
LISNFLNKGVKSFFCLALALKLQNK